MAIEVIKVYKEHFPALVILSKEFDNVCCSSIAFSNPDAAALDCAKKLVDYKRQEIKK